MGAGSQFSEKKNKSKYLLSWGQTGSITLALCDSTGKGEMRSPAGEHFDSMLDKLISTQDVTTWAPGERLKAQLSYCVFLKGLVV